jgi:ribonucleoside-triphosphate reductase
MAFLADYLAMSQRAAPYVSERFLLSKSTEAHLRTLTPRFGFDGLGEVVYYRTYSRTTETGGQETWADTVVRVIQGIMSIRKDYQLKHGLGWNEQHMQGYAADMAQSLFDMHFLPPGRGLWACGTDFMYTRGSAALNNCGACTTKDLPLAVGWTMDMLMCGVGVGFDTEWTCKGVSDEFLNTPPHVEYVPVEDSREGWVASTVRLVEWYVNQDPAAPKPVPSYERVRPSGTPIKGFGGTASGAEPLRKLHARIDAFFRCFYESKDGARAAVCRMVDRLAEASALDDDPEDLKKSTQTDTYDATRLVADIMNAIGCCVVAGNVRRSAEIALGRAGDETFLNLKNYEKHPERRMLGWMSNNSLVFSKHEDFERLPSLADRIRSNGEPGLLNVLNVQRFGRIGRRQKHHAERVGREGEEDKATLVNPCAEIPLEPFELCNLAEVFPTRCTLGVGDGTFHTPTYLKAIEYATFYASTVSLLPTHWTVTNRVIARNHRIGVSLSGIADWYATIPFTQMVKHMQDGYRTVLAVNARLATESGVPAAIRVTTVKPSGSISLLAGVSPGLHFPTHRFCIRRVRVGTSSPIAKTLIASGIPHEKDSYSDNTWVFEFVIDQSHTRPASEVSVWEQASLLTTLQREWSDNAVSVTLYFNPKTEGHQLEHLLAQYAPLVKSLSMLPHTEAGVYKQSPLEGISKDEYDRRRALLPTIDWSVFTGGDGEMAKFCTNAGCE